MENVRTISRGIELLAYLKRSGGATGSQIAVQLGLSRPSTYRILGTLEECGLVRHSPTDNKYSLAWKARTLSSGLTLRNRMLCIATPVLYELQETVVWPTDLAIHENGEMVIQETTHLVSPYSIDTGMVRSRHPLLVGSLGRAYAGFCPDDELEEILRHFMPRCTGGREALGTPAQVEWIVARTRKDGFGSRNREGNLKTSSIALPIRHEGRVLACMNVSWISSALSFDEAAARFCPALKEACLTVERRLLDPSSLDAGAGSLSADAA